MYNCDRATYGGAPPLSMPRECQPGTDVVHDGLGFWSALIPLAGSLVGGLIDGGNDIDERAYYQGAKSTIFCPQRSAYPIGQVAEAIRNMETTGAGATLRQSIASTIASDTKWAKYSVAPPVSPREQAAVLINWGNGWRYCPRGETVGPKDVTARALVDRIVAHEAQRQRTLREMAAAAQQAGAGALTTLAQSAPVIAGVSNTALLGGAALVAVLLLRRR